MADIVKRLCAPVSDDDDYMIGRWPGEPPKKYDALRLEAADEIERLRAALHQFAEAAGKFDPDEGDGSQHVWGWSPTIGMLRKARAALEGK